MAATGSAADRGTVGMANPAAINKVMACVKRVRMVSLAAYRNPMTAQNFRLAKWFGFVVCSRICRVWAKVRRCRANEPAAIVVVQGVIQCLKSAPHTGGNPRA